MSGVAEEILTRPGLSGKVILVRASSHIRTQYDLLAAEEQYAGRIVEKPGFWMIRREEREYQLAWRIRVLSGFARNSFMDHGFSLEKVWLHPSSFPKTQFTFDQKITLERAARIRSGKPLRVLFVGALIARKGMKDLQQLIDQIPQERMCWRLVGPAGEGWNREFARFENTAVLGKKPQARLIEDYQWADLFVFPTIEDGFPQVLAQAHLQGLPILTTSNGSGPDFIEENKTGWVFPIRRPDLMKERLLWCDAHREELARMVLNFETHLVSARTWEQAAKEAEVYIGEWIQK
jgi:glycosyltransferase involved in cell wall biosynthesis